MGPQAAQHTLHPQGWQADVVPLHKLKGAELDTAASQLANGRYHLSAVDLPARRSMGHDSWPHDQLVRLEQCIRGMVRARGYVALSGAWHDALRHSLPA